MECSIPSELEESVRELLGKKADTSYRRLVRLDVKADKQEQRILALTDYRLYILSAKSPAKIEHNVHYLDITCLESKKPTQIVVATAEHRKLSMSLTEKDAEGAIRFMTAELRRSFPTTMLTEIMKMEIEPSDRQRQLSIQPRESMLRDVGPCGGFSLMYEAICDYYHQPFLEEVAWDVDTIYLSQDSKELNLSDFDHLGIKHLVPIIGTLQYDSWFTSLNANNVRLVFPPETTEAVNEVLRVMKKNCHLQELHLRNVGAKWEFAHKLAMALLHNNNSQLTVLDLSENPIEDRGMNHMCSPIRTLQKGLKHLNLSRTGITAKGVNRLADSLCANRGVTTSLTFLDLSDNALKGEDITNLYNFWAQPNVISTLRLSGTECALENLFGALLPGCCRHLTHLDLSHNVFSHRRTKEPNVPPSWKQFFATAESLKVINLSDTKLTAEALKNVVLGLASNLKLQDVELDVSSNNLRATGADILQMSLPESRNIATLNISDNAFDNDMMGICNKLTQCHSIKRLHIGRNFNNIKPKYMPQVMDALVQMIQDEESTIESISFADSRLKNDTTLIINALGSNSTLTEIDLSGNLMGDVGARMLAKALQINTKLHTIYWDRNGTTVLGLSDIAHGLSKNHSVKKMPSPINDAAFALRLNSDKTEQALQKIEEVLKRNHSPRKLASDQGYRLHQGFLISSSQQMLDRLVVQVREHITTLEKGSRNLTEDAKTDLRNATRLVTDANATKQVLPKLQQVALQVEHEGNLIDTKLSSVTQDLHSATQRQLKRTMSDMMKCMEQQCPTIMEDEEFTRTLQTSSIEKSTLPATFTKTLLIDNVGADIMNKVSELNLAVASHISDRLIDGVLDSLDACHKKLTNHINSADSLTSPLSPEPKKPPRPENPPAFDKGRTSGNVEDDVFDEVAAQSTIKRKSLYSRRLRPQSVIGDDEDGKPGETDDGSRENKDLSPIPQSPGTPKSPSLSLRSASSASDISLPPLEELPKLEHLGKSRPRRNKTRAVSRAALKADRSIEDIKEVAAGVDEFFERKEISREFVKPTAEEKETEKGDEEKRDDSKKKGWSPFNSQPNPKGLAAGISSFFGRRDKPSPTRSPETSRRLTTHEEDTPRSPEPARRSINKSPTPERRRTREKEPEPDTAPATAEEPKKKEEEEPTPPWRRSATALPTASTGGSTSGGASALLAEMRAKRASAINTKPLSPTSSKNDNKENKENNKDVPGNRSSIIPPPKENRNSIHPPASVKDRTSVTPAAALRPTSGQTSTRPVPAPRANSPATSTDKSSEKTDEAGDSSPKNRLSFLSKPRPPPIAPKPRSKPTSPAASSAKPTIITTPRTSALTGRISVYARIRESIGEKPTIPSSASTEKDDKDSEEAAKPPPRTDRARRRLSVKEKVAFLDKNSNEQPAEQPLGRRASLAKADQAAPKVSDPPQRGRSMYGGESPLKNDDSSSGGATGNGRKPSDTDDGQDTPNGAAKNDGEFVLFL